MAESGAARRLCPRELWKIATRKLDQLDSVALFDELRLLPGNRLELLVGDRQGQNNIRMNERYRICFLWGKTGPDQVEIVEYH